MANERVLMYVPLKDLFTPTPLSLSGMIHSSRIVPSCQAPHIPYSKRACAYKGWVGYSTLLELRILGKEAKGNCRLNSRPCQRTISKRGSNT
jgi:hypothetical protein